MTSGWRSAASDRRTALALLLLGSLLALVAAGRPWQTLLLPLGGGLPTSRRTVTGNDVAGAVRALAVVGLASTAALVAARGRLRRLVGLVVALLGVGIVVAAWEGARATPAVGERVASTSVWPAIAMLGGALVLAGGFLAVVFCRRWSALGSRYESPGAGSRTIASRGSEATAAPSEERERPTAGDESVVSIADAWKAFDRGEDPTAGDRGS